MKRTIATLLQFCIGALLFAQAPQAFNYQGIARDAGGAPIVSQPIGIRFQLHQGTATGTVVYAETQATTTSIFGLFSLEVGNGTPVTGSFAAIAWAAGPYFLEVGMDPAGGSNYSSVGTQQMLSVPYALYAETSGSSGSSSLIAGNNITISNDTISASGSTSVFDTLSGVVLPSSAVDETADDFVFGSTQLDDDGNAAHDKRLFFDKSKGAFRAGKVVNENWDADSVGQYSFAAGNNTKASGAYSFAVGNGSEATSSAAIAVGFSTSARGFASFTSGRNTVAQGSYSLAFGLNGVSSGYGAMSLGLNNQALGNFSFAAGRSNWTSGTISSAMGIGLKSRSYAEVSLGSYNTDQIPDDSTSWSINDRIFSIGNGANSSNRSDALVILKSGNMGLGTSTPDTTFHLVGKMKYQDGSQHDGYVLTSDSAGMATWLPASSSTGTAVFDTLSGVVLPGSAVDETSDDFVFGSTQLDDDGNTDHYDRFFFDKSKGAFRAGRVDGAHWDEANLGERSIAMGSNTIASGNKSFAVGQTSTASGNYSSVLGFVSTASGNYSTAMGSVVTASGNYSTAIGASSTASGYYSTAIGRASEASGYYSTALGNNTIAPSAYEFVVGASNSTYVPHSTIGFDVRDRLFTVGNGANSSNRSDALVILKSGNLGLGTSTPDTTFHLVGKMKYQDGSENDGYVLTSDADGNATWTATSSLAIPSIFDTLSGVVLPGSAVDETSDDFVFGSTQLDDDGNPGHDSRFFFDKSKGAFRVGRVVNKDWDVDSLGQASFAAGFGTKATGLQSVALGRSTVARGTVSFASGDNTNASGSRSTAMGIGTTADGTYSTAMGQGTVAHGNSSATMGSNTEANGDYSTAMGYNTKANGESSTTMGRANTANGDRSLVVGSQSHTYGDYSMALGRQIRTYGEASLAGGQGAQTFSFGEIALGSYNTTYTPVDTFSWQMQDRILSIGNGSSDANRSDALVILKSGNLGLGTSTPDTTFHLVGKMKYQDGSENDGYVLTSDADGIATWTAVSSLAIPSVFDTLNGVVLPGIAVNETSDDFVFGSTQLDDDGNSDHDSRFFFDKGKGAFRAGRVINENWDADSIGMNSFAAGYNTKASQAYSFAVGKGAEASDDEAVAMGLNTSAQGVASFAAGANTVAQGDFSLAFGLSSLASGYGAISLGLSNQSLGSFAFAAGRANWTSGTLSSAMGRGLRSRSYAEVALGSYNTDQIPDDSTSWSINDRIFSVGNGANSSNRSDALTILKSGNLGLGTSTPDTTFHLVGKMKYQDGTQADGRVLTSDADGNATWGSASELSDADGDTKIQVEKNADEDIIRFDMGGEEHFFMRPDTLGVKSTSQNTFINFSRPPVLRPDNTIQSVISGLVAPAPPTYNYLYLKPGGNRTLSLGGDGTVTVNEEYTLPTTDGTSGQMLATDGSGNVSWQSVPGIIKATVNIDLPSFGNTVEKHVETVPVAGAHVGSTVQVSPSAALSGNCAIAYAFVSSANTVKIVFLNHNTVDNDNPAMDFYVTVIK